MADWKAIPYGRHGDCPKADEDMAWDVAAQTKGTDPKKLAEMSLFEDKDNLENQTAYKGQHHTKDGNKVVWRGVTAAMAVLGGARGGFKGISQVELAKGYNHLAKHYRQFDKKPPEGGKFAGMKVLD